MICHWITPVQSISLSSIHRSTFILVNVQTHRTAIDEFINFIVQIRSKTFLTRRIANSEFSPRQATPIHRQTNNLFPQLGHSTTGQTDRCITSIASERRHEQHTRRTTVEFLWRLYNVGEAIVTLTTSAVTPYKCLANHLNWNCCFL